MLKDIDTLIFDFGGVIINVDYNKTRQAFEKLGIKNFDELYSQASQSKLFDKLETGSISTQEFRKNLNDLSKLNLDDHTIDSAWNSMLGEIPVKRLEAIARLKKHYRVFLLSNTNSIHIDYINHYMKEKGIHELFYSVFDKIYFSFEIQMRKPDIETFEFVLHENNLVASKTLFIEDSIQHIEGAKSAGIKTLFIEKGVDFSDVIR